MNLKEIKELIDILRDTDISEIEIDKAGSRVKITKQGVGVVYADRRMDMGQPQMAMREAAQAAVAAPVVEVKPEPAQDNFVVITSPIVGTFYRSPTPEAAVYVEVGDMVKKGQVLCIIEAMKLMNEIESEVNGKVVAILVNNTQPVEYGEPLFRIEPV